MKTMTESNLPQTIGNVAKRALANEGITDLKDLTKYSEEELLQLHGVGPKAIRILKEILQAQGLDFAEK